MSRSMIAGLNPDEHLDRPAQNNPQKYTKTVAEARAGHTSPQRLGVRLQTASHNRRRFSLCSQQRGKRIKDILLNWREKPGDLFFCALN